MEGGVCGAIGTVSVERQVNEKGPDGAGLPASLEVTIVVELSSEFALSTVSALTSSNSIDCSKYFEETLVFRRE